MLHANNGASGSVRIRRADVILTVVFNLRQGLPMAMIDLKSEWTTADVSALLGSVADDRSWWLEVTGDGVAKLNDLTATPEAAYEDALHCFFEIWTRARTSSAPGRLRISRYARRSSECCGRTIPLSREHGHFRRREQGAARYVPDRDVSAKRRW
jgi:hypothetical protein